MQDKLHNNNNNNNNNNNKDNNNNKLKTEKYADLRASLRRLYPGHSVIQVHLAFDFLSGYHKELIHKLNNLGLSDSMNVTRKCKKWVIAQNRYEIAQIIVIRSFTTIRTCKQSESLK